MRKRIGLLTTILAILIPGVAAAGAKVLVKVDSTPAGAMVSVSLPGERNPGKLVTVAGITPLEKRFEFGKNRTLMLTLERRGYSPQQVEISPASGPVLAVLARCQESGGKEIPDHALPRSGALRLIPPVMEVIKRGFSSEHLDPAESRAAEDSLLTSLPAVLGRRFQVGLAGTAPEDQPLLKALWRDSRTAMQLLDPVRLPYLATPPLLETGSARKAAVALGQHAQGQYLLLITGKQVQDTAGMKAGQFGILAAGTACSYASGYSRAMNNQDSFFMYTVYLPDFTSGLTLKALLAEVSTGEVCWINRGNWKSIHFDRPAEVQAVLQELLAGLL